MSASGQKVLETIQKVQQDQFKRVQSQRILDGLQAGIDLLEDKTVSAPIVMHEGLTDLKWLLQSLLGGKFSINLEPTQVRESQPLEKSPEGKGE